MLRTTSSGSFTDLPNHPLSPNFSPSSSPALGTLNDPFHRYSAMNASGTPSFANSDFNDGDSSRQLNPTRPRSNLAYGSYDDKDYGETSTAGLVANRSRLRRSSKESESGLSRKKRIIIVVVLLAVIVAAAVGAAVAIVNRNSKSNVAESARPDSPPADDATATATDYAASPTATRRPNESRNLAVGRDGSTVYLDDGSSFIYNNTFGQSPLSFALSMSSN